MFEKKNLRDLLILIFFIYSLFCALTIGQAWDEIDNYLRGKITLDYLFSLGNIKEDAFLRESYSTLYWSFRYLLTNIFPQKYLIEVGHVINLIFSFSILFGIKKIGKELFNDYVGKISFVLLFFLPFFFGHFAVNGKDTILALCHVWIFYYLIKYLKKQTKYKDNNYFLKIGILTATATGIQLVFIGSLIPLMILFLLEIFYLKNIISKHFSIKKMFKDIFKGFVFFYFILIIFWVDTHQNILTKPFLFLMSVYSDGYPTGWQYNLTGGEYFLSKNVNWDYILLNLFYKLPEFFLVLYLFFPFIVYRKIKNFKKINKFFKYNLFLIITILVFPTLILLFIPFPVYDGLRLFLWFVPYLCLVPAIVIDFIFSNLKDTLSKFSLLIIVPLFFYFVIIFIKLTPYHYTYLNNLSNKFVNKNLIFENDYWGLSLKELINKTNFNNDKKITFTTCGINDDNAKYYFKEKGFFNFEFSDDLKAEYVIMNNRVIKGPHAKLTSCYEKFHNDNIFFVERNGIILTTIRKNSIKSN